MMLRLTKPKFFLPVHGEYQHLTKHMQTAISAGVNERNIMLIADGEQIEVGFKFMRKVRSVRSGAVFVDNTANKEIESSVVHDRQNLANDGIVMVILQVNRQENKLLSPPKVAQFGLVGERKERSFVKELEDLLVQFIEGSKPEDMSNARSVENALRSVLKKHIFRTVKKYPIIVPNIFVQ